MLPSAAPSSYSRKGERSSRSGNDGHSPHARGKIPEVSDVPCYTCRRRHVKCDRTLPHCAKCAKKGVPCSGYQKPLRWADGVAVRGKLKGKTQPVADEQAASVAQAIVRDTNTSLRTEAAHFGYHALQSGSSDVTRIDANFLELIAYYNAKIAVEHPPSRYVFVQLRRIASVSPEATQHLPRDVLNCILGVAAVHMAVRNVGNRPIERLALETRSHLFQGINQLFQNPQSQRTDILYICIHLMFAMEVIQNSVNRWAVHVTGAFKLIASSGGSENFAFHYPHLKVMLALALRFEIMRAVLSPIPAELSDRTSRNALKSMSLDPTVSKAFYNSCPPTLMLLTYDTLQCAQNIHGAERIPSIADIYKREWILADCIRFQPEDATRDLIETYFKECGLPESDVQTWNLIFITWREAITILVIRHLYFGLPEPNFPFSLSRSSSPSSNTRNATRSSGHATSYTPSQDIGQPDTSYQFEESMDHYFDPAHLSPDLNSADLYTGTPSPLTSPRSPTTEMTFDFWCRRYEIHNDAVFRLSHSFSTLLEQREIHHLRYALLPLLILALISTPGSSERDLCFLLFQRYKMFLEFESSCNSPIGGSPMDFDLPWDRIDAFSLEAEQNRQENMVITEPNPLNGAPEWNWLDMLQAIDLKTLWPGSAGTGHMELGSEFWAFNVLAACCTEECFAALMEPSISASNAQPSV